MTPERERETGRTAPADKVVQRATVPHQPLVEYPDSDFPPHMFVWSIVGVIACFGIVAPAIFYAAILSRYIPQG